MSSVRKAHTFIYTYTKIGSKNGERKGAGLGAAVYVHTVPTLDS